ncbi:MAG: NarK/NasA family nitrate transporter [Chloroflexi bacterium]|nr:NarK/NasA family nitrate transporter [Chloroflexota bacterium]
MLWVLLGALGIHIAESLHLDSFEKGVMVAVPILSGSLLRLPLGVLGDRIGGKRVGMAMLLFLFVPLTIGWQAGNSLSAMMGIGLLLGTAGASFAVALPLASRWYPPERQGLVMGIAAAGNSGTVIANLAAPRLASLMGWHNVLAVAMIPLFIVLIAFIMMAKDRPSPGQHKPVRAYLETLKPRDIWWLSFVYCVTFGGYVGLGSFLPIFLRDQYGVSATKAGYLTALVAFSGSSIRPIGGLLADKFGGTALLSLVLIGVGAMYVLVAQLPSLPLMVGLLVVTVSLLGLGNGAVFQLVPLRFPRDVGVATGLVGAIGGLGGFLLPICLGSIKGTSGSFGNGFLVLGFVTLGALTLVRILISLQVGWRTSWRGSREPAA